jgi:DNA-binding transcriptional MerR regulator
MKTTTANDWPYYFTISDLARFLGKSPVTLRGWERKGLVSIPRGTNNDRRLTTRDIRVLARRARELKRITEYRLQLVETSVTLLEIIERENRKKK